MPERLGDWTIRALITHVGKYGFNTTVYDYFIAHVDGTMRVIGRRGLLIIE